MANPIIKYINEARSELAKVSWPSRTALINHTLLVIGVSIVLAIFIGGIDYALNIGVQYLLKK